MASLLGGAATRRRPRNEAPVPLVSRAASMARSSYFNRRDAVAQLDAMANNGTVFGIVDKTSTAVGGTEWRLYRSAKSGKDEDRVEVTSHAVLDLLNRPNPFMTRMELFEAAQQHIDLTGEAFLLVSRAKGFGRIPVELWPIRPDRMTPAAHPTKYLTGWVYTSPDGEQVPLDVDQVIHVRKPNPMNPYRGLGPVQTELTRIYGAQAAAEWNASFFRNDASPGGIISVEKRLTDEEFYELSERWDEQHRGVGRAHRVAMLEHGATWIDRKYTMRDMQFVELRALSRDAIMEAFGFPKPMLGITEDVNRANADAGEYVFAKWLTVPRCNRWRDVLTAKLLPMFSTTTGMEIDYDSPVPADEAAENEARKSRAEAVAALVEVGFDGNTAAKAYELPDGLVWHKPVDEAPDPPAPEPAPGPAPAPVEPGAPQPGNTITLHLAGGQSDVDAMIAEFLRKAVRNAPPLESPPDGWPERDEAAVDDVDLAPVQAAWTAALATLVETWNTTIVSQWITALIDAIKAALGGDGDRADLGTLTLDIDDATTLLADAMAAMGETAAGHAVDEAAASDVDLTATWPTADDLEAAAREIADFEARRYALTAGREAARVAGPEPDEDYVAEHMKAFLDEMSDAPTEAALGSALTDAQNQARAATLSSGPAGALYASEQMDSNTCAPCKDIHGRWIANTDDLGPLHKLYPTGGYLDCKGRWRCRGTVVGVWRSKTTSEGGE
ncbi:phage portal protein [Streptomyces sp. WAC 05977]|nr:phage portal protein [Streptomyces sp. WAC 05977]